MSTTRAEHPTAPLPAWVAACFFVSAAAGLLYEVLWSKELAYLLGSSLHAVAALRRGLAAAPGSPGLSAALLKMGQVP